MRKLNQLEYTHDFIHNGYQAIQVILDNDLRFTCATEYSAQLCGYKKWEDMVGTTVFDFPCAVVEHAPEFYQQDRTVLDERRQMQVLNINEYVGGELKFYLTHKKPLINSEDQLLGLETCNIDLSKENLTSQFCLGLYQQLADLHCKGKFQGISYEIVEAYHSHNLSIRQSEILFLLGYGKSAKHIAKLLHVSPRTVEDHIDKMRWKLDVQSKAQLTEYAIVTGLIYQVPASLIY